MALLNLLFSFQGNPNNNNNNNNGNNNNNNQPSGTAEEELEENFGPLVEEVWYCVNRQLIPYSNHLTCG